MVSIKWSYSFGSTIKSSIMHKKFDRKKRNFHLIMQQCSFYNDVECTTLMKEQYNFKTLNIHWTIHSEGLLHSRGDMVYTTHLSPCFIYRRALLNVLTLGQDISDHNKQMLITITNYQFWWDFHKSPHTKMEAA
jgi:hypothetical protein